MSKIIKFPDNNKELNQAHYVDYTGDIGVCIEGGGIEIVRLNDNDFLVITTNCKTVFDRAKLAEFLWLAAQFIDKDQKWMADDDIVACDYSSNQP